MQLTPNYVMQSHASHALAQFKFIALMDRWHTQQNRYKWVRGSISTESHSHHTNRSILLTDYRPWRCGGLHKISKFMSASLESLKIEPTLWHCSADDLGVRRLAPGSRAVAAGVHDERWKKSSIVLLDVTFLNRWPERGRSTS